MTHGQPQLNTLPKQFWHIHPAAFYFLLTILVVLGCIFVCYVIRRLYYGKYGFQISTSYEACRDDFENAREIEMGVPKFQGFDDSFGPSSSCTTSSYWSQLSSTSSTFSDLGLSRHFHRNGILRSLPDSPYVKWERDLQDRIEHGRGAVSFVDRTLDHGVRWIVEKLGQIHKDGHPTSDLNQAITTHRKSPQKQCIIGDVQSSRLAQRRRMAT